jgi:hypothetical protein
MLGELELPGHARQVDATVEAVAPEYVPAPQLVHVALPLAILYVPPPHSKHVPPSGPVDPALQVQAARAELMLGELELSGHVTQVDATVAAAVPEYVPDPQFSHTTLPLAILYVPATQAEHGPPSGPVYPALHVQAATAVLTLGELEFAAHATQVAAAVAAGMLEYVPAPQF